jgi:SPOR domain
VIIEAEYEEVEGSGQDTELDLSDDDSLPWLEAEEEDEGRSDIDIAQIIGFALILFTILAAVVGAVWYYANNSGNAEVVADGSIIEAPEGPIKERPEDPGGKEFDGTGNVAPVVAEGGTREGVLDTASEGNKQTPEASTPPTSDAAPTAISSGSGGVGVQLAAYSSRARAEQGWNDLRRRTNALDNARYRIEEGVVDIGTVYRLQAVASDRAEAQKLCAALKADGLDCQVKP